jgi:hypothetical protein
MFVRFFFITHLRNAGVDSHAIHSKFHNDWFMHSKVDGRGYTYTQTHRHHFDLISLLLFIKKRSVG